MDPPESNFRGTSTLGAEDDDVGSSECSDQNRECCPPQLFTSVLLGLLACVLVTGGVFLAFHKWDHTWLLVSAVGVLLMAIGTALHCCSSNQNPRKNHRCKGGCGGTRSKPDAVGNGGGAMLTEQLLPLSNARSVSQLSLNMVPGYFPPLVYPTSGPYGLEQHSAVVQNISKLVQHQQQLHLQSPTSAQSDSKSFILLPLPVDANATNIQNIVAAVCQFDGNASESNNEVQTTDVSSQATETSVVSRENSVTSTQMVLQPSTSTQPVLKHAEVQTCCDWVHQTSAELKSPSESNGVSRGQNVPEVTSTSEGSSTMSIVCQTVDDQLQRTIATEVAVPIVPESVVPVSEETVLQIDSASDNNCDNTPVHNNNIPNAAQPDIPIDLAATTSSYPTVESQEPAQATSETDHSSTSVSAEENLIDVLVPESGGNLTPQAVLENDGNRANSREDTTSNNDIPALSEPPIHPTPPAAAADDDDGVDYSVENLADISSDLESELFDRSSPPPSYEDVTQETPASVSLNGFGLAYGTM